MATVNSTWYGFVEDTEAALKIFEATLQGMLNAVECKRFWKRPYSANLAVRGNVYVVDEQKSPGRWIDGTKWSPSRTIGDFFVYREMETSGKDVDSETSSSTPSQTTISAPQEESPLKWHSAKLGEQDALLSRKWQSLEGIKLHGLVKKVIRVTVGNRSYKLIAYFTERDVSSAQLLKVNNDIRLMHIQPRDELLFQGFRGEFRLLNDPKEVVAQYEESRKSSTTSATIDIVHEGRDQQLMLVESDENGDETRPQTEVSFEVLPEFGLLPQLHDDFNVPESFAQYMDIRDPNQDLSEDFLWQQALIAHMYQPTRQGHPERLSQHHPEANRYQQVIQTAFDFYTGGGVSIPVAREPSYPEQIMSGSAQVYGDRYVASQLFDQYMACPRQGDEYTSNSAWY